MQSLVNRLDARDVQESRTSRQTLVPLATVVFAAEDTKQSLAVCASKRSLICGSNYSYLHTNWLRRLQTRVYFMCLVNASKQRQQRQQTINLPSVSEGDNFGGSNDSSSGGIDSRSTSRGNETKHRFSSTSQSRRQQDSCTSSAQPQREQWQRLRDAPINLSMQSAKQLNHRSERMPSLMSTKASIYSIDGACSCNQRWSSMQSGARVRQVSFDARFFIPFAKGFVLRTNDYKLRRLFYLQTRKRGSCASQLRCQVRFKLRESQIRKDSA
jgi:hypothetical protein